MESATCERGFSIRSLTKTGQRYSSQVWRYMSLLDALMMIDMNPDVQEVHEVKARILEYVTGAWKNFKNRMPSMRSAGVTRPSRSAQVMFTLSTLGT